MIGFDDYLREGKVLRRDKDPALKNSLVKDADERILQLSIAGLKPKFRFEQAYESVRELADALLARDGFKTYSHEAALSYLRKIGILNDAEMERLDVCRRKRNDSKYYGRDTDEKECERLILFLKNIFERVKGQF
ncbi:MAG: hypothetical protein KJ574_00160 [Nanoarchaeota archaeon]|nr:hypothetical protein [Nanoarchaeota archaeon]